METTGAQARTPAWNELQSPQKNAQKTRRFAYVRMLQGAVLCALAIAFAGGAAEAQNPMPPAGGPSLSRPPGAPRLPTARPMGIGADPFDMPLASMPMPAVDAMRILNTEACNTWTEAAVRSPTVSVARLAVPGKASSEYQKACGALKDKRFSDAETHARKAIERYANYAAAWVLLGQILDGQHKGDEARAACSQASSIDPGYSASYICLAEFAARDDGWEQVSKMAKRALELDPANNAYAFYYVAAAALHSKHFSDAELNGLSAAKLDPWHHMPQIHFLLAKVYEAKGDTESEAAQLRQYLKLEPHAPNSATAKNALAQLDARRAN